MVKNITFGHLSDLDFWPLIPKIKPVMQFHHQTDKQMPRKRNLIQFRWQKYLSDTVTAAVQQVQLNALRGALQHSRVKHLASRSFIPTAGLNNFFPYLSANSFLLHAVNSKYLPNIEIPQDSGKVGQCIFSQDFFRHLLRLE